MTPKIEADKKVEIEQLNNFALESIDQYQHLKIGQVFVNTPFFVNQIGLWFGELMRDANIPDDQIDDVFAMYKENKIPYGWFRGKGTPGELTSAVYELAETMHLDLSRATPESAAEFMKWLGLGVDCSGLVFNALDHAFTKAGVDGFIDTLDIVDSDTPRTKYRAGVFSFIGDASFPIKPKEVGPLDILIRTGWHDRAWHMGIILQREGYLLLAHSTLGLTPNGVQTSLFKVENNKPVFGFKPNLSPVDWEEHFDNGQMEFRRLNFVKDIKGREEMQDLRLRGERP